MLGFLFFLRFWGLGFKFWGLGSRFWGLGSRFLDSRF